MRILIVLWLLAAACETCPYRVIGEVTFEADGGLTRDSGGVYCATGCSPDQPCAADEYCSVVANPHDGSPPGLCFKNSH